MVKVGGYSKLREQGMGFGMAAFTFPRPSWLTGFARTLDLGGVFDHRSRDLTSAQSTWVALARDMDMIKRDLLKAVDNERDDPRTRLLSERDLTSVRLEVLQREIEKHELYLRRRRNHYKELRERIEAARHEEANVKNSRPEEELSWAG
jgi:hypothetical protein